MGIMKLKRTADSEIVERCTPSGSRLIMLKTYRMLKNLECRLYNLSFLTAIICLKYLLLNL